MGQTESSVITFPEAVARIKKEKGEAEYKRLCDFIFFINKQKKWISLSDFRAEVLQPIMPNIPTALADLLFSCTVTKNGNLNIGAIVSGVAVIRFGTPEERHRLLYSMYNHKHQKEVKKADLRTMLSHIDPDSELGPRAYSLDDSPAQKDLPAVSWEEADFVKWAEKHIECDLVRWINQLEENLNRFNDDYTQALSEGHRELLSETKPAVATEPSPDELMEGFSREWLLEVHRKLVENSPLGVVVEEALTNALPSLPPSLRKGFFAALDTTSTGTISVHELLTASATCCRSPKDRLQFCFRLFDANGDGRLCRDELTVLLAALSGIDVLHTSVMDTVRRGAVSPDLRSRVDAVLEEVGGKHQRDSLTEGSFLDWALEENLDDGGLVYRLWHLAHIDLGWTPESNRQKLKVFKSLNVPQYSDTNPGILGQAWYLIDAKWLGKWEEAMQSSDASVGHVNCASLLRQGSVDELERTIQFKEDYDVLPWAAWRAVSAWNGVDGGEICRKVVNINGTLELEVWPLRVKILRWKNGEESATELTVSNSLTMEELGEEAKAAFEVREPVISLWKANLEQTDSPKTLGNTWTCVTTSHTKLGDDNINEEHLFLLVEGSDSLDVVREAMANGEHQAESSSDSESDITEGMQVMWSADPAEGVREIGMVVKMDALSSNVLLTTAMGKSLVVKRESIQRRHHEDMKPRSYAFGRVGLQNLGNTCYMNAALQCLSHTRLLRDYFLSTEYQYDCNVNQTHRHDGMSGKLAVSFHQVLRTLWNCSTDSFAPRRFKNIVGKYRAQFDGWQQQDAQEFLGLLLQGLSEDLNRVEEKPYIVERDDHPGRSDQDMADERWSIHWRREESAITALFHGQEKMEKRCVECNSVTRSFPVFGHHIVTLPTVTHHYIRAKAWRPPPRAGAAPCIRVAIKVPRRPLPTVSYVVSKLAETLSLSPADIFVVSTRQSLLEGPMTEFKHYDLHRELSVYAAPGLGQANLCDGSVLVRVVHRRWHQATSLVPMQPVLFGVPSLIPIPYRSDGNRPHLSAGPDAVAEWLSSLDLSSDYSEKVREVGLTGSMVTTGKEVCSKLSPSSQDEKKICAALRVFTTGEELYSIVWQRVRSMVPDFQKAGGKYPFILTVVTSDGKGCKHCHWRESCFGCPLPPTSEKVYLTSWEVVAVDWSKRVYEEEYREKFAEGHVEEHESVREAEAAEQRVALKDCITSTAEKMDASYCATCTERKGEHRETVKEVQTWFWRLPPVLVMQFKRFQDMVTKVHTTVDFPVNEGLDLTEYLAVPNPPPLESRLRQVAEKMGVDLEDLISRGEEAREDILRATQCTVTTQHILDDASRIREYRKGPPTPDLERMEPKDKAMYLEQQSHRAVEKNVLQKPWTALATRENSVYDLYGVVNHSGHTLHCGHYFSFIREGMSHRWLRYDDRTVTPLNENDVVTPKAYLLFFVSRRHAMQTLSTMYPRVKDVKVDIDEILGEDVSPAKDRKVLKRVTSEDSTGDHRFPVRATAHLTITVNGEVICEEKDFAISFGRQQTVVGLELALETMRSGEEAVVKVHPDFIVPDGQRERHGIPAGAVVKFHVKRLTLEQAPNVSSSDGRAVYKRVVCEAPDGSTAVEDDSTISCLFAYPNKINEAQYFVGNMSFLDDNMEDALRSMKQGEVAQFSIPTSPSPIQVQMQNVVPPPKPDEMPPEELVKYFQHSVEMVRKIREVAQSPNAADTYLRKALRICKRLERYLQAMQKFEDLPVEFRERLRLDLMENRMDCYVQLRDLNGCQALYKQHPAPSTALRMAQVTFDFCKFADCRHYLDLVGEGDDALVVQKKKEIESALNEATRVPHRYKVESCGSAEHCNGIYVQTRTVGGMPAWECQGKNRRIFSTDQAEWMIGDEDGVMRNVGYVRTDAHCRRSPHAIQRWYTYIGHWSVDPKFSITPLDDDEAMLLEEEEEELS